MPPMPVYYVGKGTQFRVLDMFDGTDEAVYDAALERLNSTMSLTTLAANRAAAPTQHSSLTDTDINHFQKDWLERWWPNMNVELVLRGGIRKALEVAKPNDERATLLPVEALWVCASEGVFQVYVNEGPHQITVIIFTPPPKYEVKPEGRHVFEERIWVVKTRDEWDGTYDTITAPSIRRLNPEDEWPILIERQLHYAVTDPPGPTSS